MAIILIISMFCLLVNIPMGMWRSRERKFSLQWFVAVHAPVPLVVIIRLTSGTPYHYIPLFVFFSVVGQLLGGVISKRYYA